MLLQYDESVSPVVVVTNVPVRRDATVRDHLIQILQVIQLPVPALRAFILCREEQGDCAKGLLR